MAKKTKSKSNENLTRAQIIRKALKNTESPVIIDPDVQYFEFIPTKFKRLNNLLGGGIPRGAIIEVFGFEDSGKTSFCISTAADIQKYLSENFPEQNYIDYIDFEHIFDEKWARTLGLDTSRPNFQHHVPDSLEEGMDLVIDLVKTGETGLIIVDSVAAAVPKAELDGSMERHNVGIAAKRWAQALGKLKGIMSKNKTTGLFINHARDEISARPTKSWAGPPITTPRGRTLKFYSWVRIHVWGSNLDRSQPDGKLVTLKILKNKTSSEQRGSVQYKLFRGVGFDVIEEYVGLACQFGIIEQKGGGNFYIGDVHLRGKAKLIQYLKDNESVLDDVLKKVDDSWSNSEDENDKEEESDTPEE